MKDGTFHPKKGFTAVQNTVAKDVNLSLKGKGLYLLIQAYITIPKTTWKKSDFFNMCIEGEEAFERVWKELKHFGYLKTHIRSVNGKFQNEYELLDVPKNGPHTIYYNAQGEITKTNETRTLTNRRNANCDNSIHSNVNCPNVNRDDDFAHDINNNTADINLTPNNDVNNPCSNPSYPPYPSDKTDRRDKYSEYEKHFRDSLDIDTLIQRYPPDKKTFEGILGLIVDVCASSNPTIRIGSDDKPKKVVMSMFMRLNSEHLLYVVDSIKANSTKIKKMRPYLLTALYNAPFTIEPFYVSKMNHDFAIQNSNYEIEEEKC